MADAFRIESPADQAHRRRRQLVAVIAHLVVTRGVGDVTHASVAELAGCARSLVYRYFPRQEDLLYALLTTFDDELRRRMTLDQEIAGVLALAEPDGGSVPEPTRELFDRLWTPDDWRPPELEFRLACVILMRDSSLRKVLGSHDPALQDSLTRHLAAPLGHLGLRPIEIGIFVDSMLSVMQHVTRAAWAGEMGRDEALDLFVSVNSRVLQAFTTRTGA
jgi:AcrR family transcriptional regulator